MKSHLHIKWQTSEFVDHFTYLESNISSTESHVNICYYYQQVINHMKI